MLLAGLYLGFLALLALMAYEDYRYTIVRDPLVFGFLWLSGMPLAFFEGCWVCAIAWTVFVYLAWILYSRLGQREILFPYLVLALSVAFSLVDVLVGKTFFVLAASMLAFALLLYYLRFWALGDIFAFLGVSMGLAPLSFALAGSLSPVGFLGFFVSSVPLQIQMLMLAVVGYVPYVATIWLASRLREGKEAVLEILEEYLLILGFSGTIGRISDWILGTLLALLLSLAYSLIWSKISSRKLFRSANLLALLALDSWILVSGRSVLRLLEISLGIFILEQFLLGLRSLSGKRYVRISELADGDIPGFYLVKLQNGEYRYIESLAELGPRLREIDEVLIRARNPNGLYPEHIDLLRRLHEQKLVPEYVPIYKGLPMLPAFFFGGLVAVLIFTII